MTTPLFRKGPVYDAHGRHIFTLTRDVYPGEVMQPEDFALGGRITEPPKHGGRVPPEVYDILRHEERGFQYDDPLEELVREVANAEDE